ncbi:MAG: glycosyltransferase family 4 protein [Phycisphaeraceae bacterium]
MRILLITGSSPTPPTSGDRQRTDMIYRALQRVGETDLLLFRDEAGMGEGALERLRQGYGLVGQMAPPPRGRRGWWRVARPLAPGMVDRLAYHLGSMRQTMSPNPAMADYLASILAAKPYDLVVSRYIWPGLWSAPWRHRPTIIDIDGYPPQVYARRLAWERPNVAARLLLRHHLRQTSRLLPPLLRQARHLWVANPHDRAEIDHPSVSLLPNIPYQPQGQLVSACPPGADPQRITMVGSLNHPPNIDGLSFFLAQIWPGIRQARSGARLSIVGRGLSESLRNNWSAQAGVEVVGAVSDVRPAYADSSFSVVPLFTGGGTKIKVLESLMYGRTCVVSTYALRGYEHVLRDAEALLVADKPDDMVGACLRLMDQPAYRDALASRGRALVQQHYSFDAFASVVGQTVQNVVSKQPGEPRFTPPPGRRP